MWQITRVEQLGRETFMIHLHAPGTQSTLRTTTTAKDELEAYQKALVLFPLKNEE
jgi:hypothetical protein